jgi:hypothetical protein
MVSAANIRTQRRIPPRSGPYRFNPDNRVRFLRVKRAELFARIGGEPTPIQEQLIDNIACLEWAARRAEAADTLVGERDGREHRRLLLRVLADFERTLTGAPPPKPRFPKPGPSPVQIDGHLANLPEGDDR